MRVVRIARRISRRVAQRAPGATPTQSSHPRSGAPGSGRRGTPCDSWGSGRARPRSRRCATPGSPRRPGTRPTRRAAPNRRGALVAASGHHRDRRGRHSELLRDDDGDLVRPKRAVRPGRARSVQPSLRRHVEDARDPAEEERAGDVDAGVAPRKVGLGPFEVGVEGRLRSREGGGERGEGEHGGL